MSTYSVRVVPVELLPHPNADSLSIVMVGQYQCVVRTGDWKGVDSGVYIPPDYVVPDIDCFQFARSSAKFSEGRCQDGETWMKGIRIKVRKFRGQWSQGLLMRVQDFGRDVTNPLIEWQGSQSDNMDMPTAVLPRIGDDVMERLGIGRYEPPVAQSLSGVEAAPPALIIPVYDMEHWEKFAGLLVEGEPLYVTEKIHGCNVRMVYTEGKFFVGSHRRWVVEDPKNAYWRALRETPCLAYWLENHPDVVLFGEVYGDVQDMTYGKKKGSGDIEVRFFDVMRAGKYLTYPEVFYLIRSDETLMMATDIAVPHPNAAGDIPWVPVIAKVPYTPETLRGLADGKSLIAPDQIREGIVVRPVENRMSVETDRVVLKVVSMDYYARD